MDEAIARQTYRLNQAHLCLRRQLITVGQQNYNQTRPSIGALAMTSISLQDKVALVTGASRGIGRAFAQRLARAGATVVVTARSLESSAVYAGTLAETVALIAQAGGKAIAIQADIESDADLESLIPRTLQAAGRLDILVSNAGVAEYATVEKMPDECFEQTLRHYFTAPFRLARAAIPAMRTQGAGWIVNVGSVTAQRPLKPYDVFSTQGGATVYAAVKAALARFTQGLAAELQHDNIAVNLVAPSTAIRTPSAQRYIPEEYPSEPVEYIAEAMIELCHRPAAERTGLLAHSLNYVRHLGVPVYGLDSGERLPAPLIPAYTHPEIMDAGE